MPSKTTAITDHGLPISIAFNVQELTAEQAKKAALDAIGPFDTEFEHLGREFVSESGQYVAVVLDEEPPSLVGIAPAEDPKALVAVELLQDAEIEERVARDGFAAESQLVQFVTTGEPKVQAINIWLLRVLPVEDQQVESPNVLLVLEETGDDPPVLGLAEPPDDLLSSSSAADPQQVGPH